MPKATKTLPRFQKRQYEAAAKAMQDAQLAGGRVHHAIALLADMFASDNPRFDRERFLAACAPGANVRARTANIKAKGNGQLPSNQWRAGQ